jgi:hypothetical protein
MQIYEYENEADFSPGRSPDLSADSNYLNGRILILMASRVKLF